MTLQLVTNKKIAETSSKGNQEKWFDAEQNRWYKLDLFGYEALAEVVCSALLQHINLAGQGLGCAVYRMEKLEVHRHLRIGCSSENFLKDGQAIVTVAGLLKRGCGPDWQSQLKKQPNLAAKVQWLARQVEQLTGLERFGAYLTLLFELDMLFLNEDRHLNNIAVLRCGESFAYCPLFDFGAGLLSNLRDYPLDVAPKSLLGQTLARPLNCGFTRQVHAAQAVYGPQLQGRFTMAEVEAALAPALLYYPERDRADLHGRVTECIRIQQKKLFGKNNSD